MTPHPVGDDEKAPALAAREIAAAVLVGRALTTDVGEGRDLDLGGACVHVDHGVLAGLATALTSYPKPVHGPSRNTLLGLGRSSP